MPYVAYAPIIITYIPVTVHWFVAAVLRFTPCPVTCINPFQIVTVHSVTSNLKSPAAMGLAEVMIEEMQGIRYTENVEGD